MAVKTGHNLEEDGAAELSPRQPSREFAMAAVEKVLPCQGHFHAAAQTPPESGVDSRVAGHGESRQIRHVPGNEIEFRMIGKIERRTESPAPLRIATSLCSGSRRIDASPQQPEVLPESTET